MLTPARARRLSPSQLREEIARGRWTGKTTGLAPGHLQANLAVLPRNLAFDFLLFCVRNPKPCPLLEVTGTGEALSTQVAGTDLRDAFPRYRIYRDGAVIDEPISVREYWRDDLVAFLLGCSLSFEDALLEVGVPLRHLEADRALPIYRTEIACRSAGVFRGNMAVSMRPIPGHLVSRAVQVSGRFPKAHGTPVHVGDPSAIGIKDLDDVCFGEPPYMKPGDVPVFTACGVTPQLVAADSGVGFMITHYPEHMLVCDLRSEELADGV